MPLYKYQCAKCGHVMEVLEKADTQGRHICEKCGAARMEKMMSAFSVNASPNNSGSCCPTGTCSLS